MSQLKKVVSSYKAPGTYHCVFRLECGHAVNRHTTKSPLPKRAKCDQCATAAVKETELGDSVAEAKGRLWVLPFDRSYEFRGNDGEAWMGSIDEDCLTTEQLEQLDSGGIVEILYDKETKALYQIETPGDHR